MSAEATVEGRALLRHAQKWKRSRVGVCVFTPSSWKDELQHSWWRWWTHAAMTFCLFVCVCVCVWVWVPAVLCFVFDTHWFAKGSGGSARAHDGDREIWPNAETIEVKCSPFPLLSTRCILIPAAVSWTRGWGSRPCIATLRPILPQRR